MRASSCLPVAVMLAAAVEFVEAFTIVLAMGLTRGWRSTLAGHRGRAWSSWRSS